MFPPLSPPTPQTPQASVIGANERNFWPRALGVAGICVFLAGAGTSQRVHPSQLAPETEIDIQAEPDTDTACDPIHDVRLERGQTPAQARITHRVAWRATRALPLSYAEKELLTAARRQCGHGITLQNAIADEGATGVIEVRALIWVLPRPSPP